VHVSDHVLAPALSKWTVLDLSKKFPADLLDPSLLDGVYIPNLIASPFTVSKSYAELIYNRTSSPRLEDSSKIG
jgi:hypothetical protein